MSDFVRISVAWHESTSLTNFVRVRITVSPRGRDLGPLSTSRPDYAGRLVGKDGIMSSQSTLALTGVQLRSIGQDEVAQDWPFREAVGIFMWLANQSRPHIADAARGIAR